MGPPTVFLPLRRSLAKACHRIGFVDEDVATKAMVDERLRGRRVAGYHNDAVRRIEPEAERIDHILMLCGECGDPDFWVLVNDTRRDLVRIHSAAGRPAPIDTVGPGVDVYLPSLEHVLRHGIDP